MQGTILTYDAKTASGLIATNSGRYSFLGSDFISDARFLAVGTTVDFMALGETAKEIHSLRAVAQKASAPTKSKVAAGLLALFLGGLGIHKFYFGANTAGIIMLLASIIGIFMLLIPNVVIGIIGFIEGILYLTKSDDAFYEEYEVGKKPWF